VKMSKNFRRQFSLVKISAAIFFKTSVIGPY
jgi:hypothetical protein